MRSEGRRMGVSFRVSKRGTRFQPRPIARSQPTAAPKTVECFKDISLVPRLIGPKLQAHNPQATDKSAALLEQEVSFTLNLFPNGYFIGKTNEQLHSQEYSKSILPYNRVSESLFSAIETGWLPGDILDDIPSKFSHGSLICEVRDYRKCVSEQGLSVPSMDSTPLIKRIRLHMTLENIVKDMPSISDDSWTYRDLLEVESRILKVVQPNIVLDPVPMMDRLCQNPIYNKLDLGLSDLRKKRPRLTPEVTVMSNSQTNGKKIFIDKLPTCMIPNTPLNPSLQSHQTMVNSIGKRDIEDARLMHMNSTNKRLRTDSAMQQPPLQTSSPLDGIHGTEMQWKNPLLMAGGGSYLNYPATRLGIKEDKTEAERYYDPEKLKNNILQVPEKEAHLPDPLHYAQQLMSRGHFPPQPQQWHLAENKKADSIQKKMSALSPRVSSGHVANSPASPKSGELSGGSMGSGMVAQREKSSLTSSGNAYKRKPNHPLKNQVAGSPASAGTSTAPLAVSGNTEQILDNISKLKAVAQRYGNVMEKNRKPKDVPPRKLKPPSSQNASCVTNALNSEDYTDPERPMSRSLLNGTVNTAKMRVLTFFRQEHLYQGMPVPSAGLIQDYTKLTMTEMPTDRTVIMHYGSIDESDPQSSHTSPLVLPNTKYADLLAAEFTRLMGREKYQLKEDLLQPLPSNMVNNPDGSGTTYGLSENAGPSIQQRPPAASPAGQGAVGLSGPSLSFQNMPRLMTPAPLTGVQQSFLPGRVPNLPLPNSQADQLALQQPQPPSLSQGQTQTVQMQKSMPMMGATSLSRLMGQSPGMPMASNPVLGSKSVHLQMQMMQQQQQHHPQMAPGKPMMGMGSVMGMGTTLRGMPGQMSLGPAAGFGPNLPASISPVQMTAIRLRMAQQQQQQSRAAAAAVAGFLCGSQPGIMGGQMLASSPAGLSMLGQSNRPTMGPPQRPTMTSMGPPKVTTPSNFYLNQQQQQQQQQLMAQQQQQQQQQQMGSPMQQMQVGSPALTGSPSGITVQQMSQQTPASPQQMNPGGATPASPQISSQTLGNIVSSPMEQLQSSNKVPPL